VTNPAFRAIYDTYSFHVIPTIGEIVANDRASYQYLVESIRKFSNQDELASRLDRAGFSGAKYTNMTGGIVALHEGWKPV
jgi:ubiquinone/menaquinone biosynthesis C-methylase UbiE